MRGAQTGSGSRPSSGRSCLTVIHTGQPRVSAGSPPTYTSILAAVKAMMNAKCIQITSRWTPHRFECANQPPAFERNFSQSDCLCSGRRKIFTQRQKYACNMPRRTMLPLVTSNAKTNLDALFTISQRKRIICCAHWDMSFIWSFCAHNTLKYSSRTMHVQIWNEYFQSIWMPLWRYAFRWVICCCTGLWLVVVWTCRGRDSLSRTRVYQFV